MGTSNQFGLTALDIIYNTPSLQSLYSQHMMTENQRHSLVGFSEHRGRSRQLKPLNETLKYLDEELHAEPLKLGDILSEREMSPPRYEINSSVAHTPYTSSSEPLRRGTSKLTQEITDVIMIKPKKESAIHSGSSETLVEITKKHRKKSMDLGTFIKMIKKRWIPSKKDEHIPRQEKLKSAWDESDSTLDSCWKTDSKRYSVLSLSRVKTNV
ncbi:hypothetical protein K7432_016166 [Basidiobolus ranarum]|uniref:Uncharacterized protein n=1 Tax=Basidiobolus ranarum TaxID=34480 RepID=A0ABR2WF31_9FUNG